jgi:hypothetical protein
MPYLAKKCIALDPALIGEAHHYTCAGGAAGQHEAAEHAAVWEGMHLSHQYRLVLRYMAIIIEKSPFVAVYNFPSAPIPINVGNT